MSSVLEETPLPQGSPMEILHMWVPEEMCSPVLAWWQEGKFSSDLGPWKLIARFLPFPHTWLICGLNAFVSPPITLGVIQAGSVLQRGCSFCHSDKSSIVLKPPEISLPRKETCLFLGCIGNVNNCTGSEIISVACICITSVCPKRSEEPMSKCLLFAVSVWCTLSADTRHRLYHSQIIGKLTVNMSTFSLSSQNTQ